VNPLLTTNNAAAFNTDFIGLLTQVWNFADATDLTHVPPFDNRLIPLIAQTVPVRTYRDPIADGTAKPGQTVIELPSTPSWNNYSQALQLEAQSEVPPLPGQDASIGNDIHHRIRDFMLLDAAVNRIFSGSSLSVSPPSEITFQGTTLHIQRIDLGAVTAVEDRPTQPEVSRGTGFHPTSGKLLVDTNSVSSNGTLVFVQRDVEITLRLYELRDQADHVASVVPNWFGAAVPNGVTDFSKPILYFHPTPGQNNYIDTTTAGGRPDNNYLAKTATGPWTGSGRDWRELFAYMDRLGNQLAGAILQHANRNQIIIMPFMTTDSASAAGIAFLKANWLAILTSILQDISANPG
jgi:hypothetical protein